ncbi:MAG: hypothetical protein B7X11_03030, partial [Acidobacteria bacterium 37-65-4]
MNASGAHARAVPPGGSLGARRPAAAARDAARERLVELDPLLDVPHPDSEEAGAFPVNERDTVALVFVQRGDQGQYIRKRTEPRAGEHRHIERDGHEDVAGCRAEDRDRAS